MRWIMKFLNPQLLVSAALLAVSCSGDIYEKQADIYGEYRSRLDTAATCQGMKNVNDALEMELAALYRNHGNEVQKSAKEAKKYRESEARLAKAESEYMNVYLNRFFEKNLQQQSDLYAEYAKKVNAAATYDELSGLYRSLNGALADATSKYSAEFKKAAAKKILPERFAALDKVKESFFGTYTAKVAPLLNAHETGIYEKYIAKLENVADFKSIKEVKLYFDKEMAIFNKDNEVVYKKMSQSDYSTFKARSQEAGNSFKEYYMNKVALPLIEYQKQIYNGAAEMMSAANSADELNLVNKSFVDLNNVFVKENGDELGWIEKAVLAGDRRYKVANEELNACLENFFAASEKRAVELGLK